MIQNACEGLPITDVQLRQELEEGGDLVAMQSGALTLNGLRLTAETLALMRYSTVAESGTRLIKTHNTGEVT